MRIIDFENLPLDVKTSYIWDHGVCMHRKLEENIGIVCIFRVDSFFVEAYYSAKDNGIRLIRPLKEYFRWESYVDQVVAHRLLLS